MVKKHKDDDEPQDETPETSIAVNDAWTGMLAVSLLALVVATAFLLWDYSLLSDPPQILRVTNKQPAPPAKVEAPPPKAPDAPPPPAAKDAPAKDAPAKDAPAKDAAADKKGA